MSYAMRRGFGSTVATKTCATNASFNVPDDTCYCNAGYVSDDPNVTPCKLIDPASPCPPDMKGSFRSPMNKHCQCPPGFQMSTDPTRNDCVPMYYFPTCKDAKGNSVPNCFFGMPMDRVLPAVAGGVVAGIALTMVAKAFLR